MARRRKVIANICVCEEVCNTALAGIVIEVHVTKNPVLASGSSHGQEHPETTKGHDQEGQP